MANATKISDFDALLSRFSARFTIACQEFYANGYFSISCGFNNLASAAVNDFHFGSRRRPFCFGIQTSDFKALPGAGESIMPVLP